MAGKKDSIEGLEKLLRNNRQAFTNQIVMIINAFTKKWGEEAWKVLDEEFEKIGRERAPRLKERLKLNPDDASDIARMIDYEDGLVGIEGKWVERSKNKAVKIESECGLMPALKACPEYCSRLMIALERGTFDGLGGEKRKTLKFGDIKPEGKDVCEVIVEAGD